jgi:hypothetical protein
MAEIVYWAPLVGFVGMIILAFRIEREQIALLYQRKEVAELMLQVERKVEFIKKSNAIVVEAIALRDYGADAEAAEMLMRLVEVQE